MSDRTARQDLTPSLLLRAYAAGVFPMAEDADAEEIFWIDPELRGVLPLRRFHAPRSLLRKVRRTDYRIEIDRDFAGVMQACADRETTWINDEIRRLYVGLFRAGYAHSVEYRVEGRLLGGLYGVKLGAAFFGESMFSRATDASKIALVHLIARLKAGGFQLLDVQFVSAHLATFGARALPRRRYHDLLEIAVATPANFDALAPSTSHQEVAQLSTQTSYR